MSITFTITNLPANIPGQASTMTFEQGGSIGRTRTCDWVLIDASRYISGKHAIISEQNGTYHITDTSMNGIFINHSSQTLGKGNSVPLNDGDVIKIGEYLIAVSIQGTTSAPASYSPPQSAGYENPAVNLPPMQSPIPPMGNNKPANPQKEAVDPLQLLGGGNQAQQDPPVLNSAVFNTPNPISNIGASQQDHASALNVHFQPPDIIPNDWNVRDSGSPQKISAIPESPARPSAHTSQQINFAQPGGNTTGGPAPGSIKPQQRPVNQPNTSSPRRSSQNLAQPAAYQAPPRRASQQIDANALQSFIQGLGINDLNLNNEEVAEFMFTAGKLLREAVKGTYRVLRARTNIKSEFRMSVTTIQAVENNPLKFSVSMEEALNNMFSKKSSSFMPPAEALVEAFDDIESHQLAIIAGIQAALTAVVKQFDPNVLEVQFDNDMGSSIFTANKKSKYWDSFIEFYMELASSLNDNFQGVIGDEFARAYEAQVSKLNANRKKR